jgi:hypothetical protein
MDTTPAAAVTIPITYSNEMPYKSPMKSPAKMKIGDSDFIIHRKSPCAQRYEKMMRLQIEAPIKEESEGSEHASSNRESTARERKSSSTPLRPYIQSKVDA